MKWQMWISMMMATVSLDALADTLSLNPDADNTLYEDATGSLSGGADPFIYTGNGDASLKMHSVLHFSVAGSIPAGSVITSATLQVTMDVNDTGFQLVYLYPVLKAWGEGTSSAANTNASTPNSATWIHTFFNTSLWSNAGGDYAGVESAFLAMTSPGTYDFSSAAMVADVQAWLDTPSTNFGWLMRDQNETLGAGSLRFDSREFSIPSARPSLIIGYLAAAQATTSFTHSTNVLVNVCTALSGHIYQLQYVTNLVGSQTWTPSVTVTATTTTATTTDTGHGPACAYRVMELQF